jgi:dihydroxy-acid dehydratase
MDESVQETPVATTPIQLNPRSRNITEGKSRAPNRSMYYAMGYKEEDFRKPMVGVANGHSTITPCNSGLQKLADAAIAGIEEAGGNAQVFGTPTISDGMAMGTEGMKYSLVSREVISDCIETCVQGQWMDGVLVVGGCDKNMPGGLMGMLRANVPAIYVYGGTILPGKWKGQDLNIVSVFEAVGQNAAGNICARSRCARSRAPAPAAACTRPTRCRARSRRWAFRCPTPPPWPIRTTRR